MAGRHRGGHRGHQRDAHPDEPGLARQRGDAAAVGLQPVVVPLDLEAHPQARFAVDVAGHHGLVDGDSVVVESPHGSMRATVACSADVHRDSVSLSHGWSDANVSLLTSERYVDGLTGMVVQTAIPVELRRVVGER